MNHNKTSFIFLSLIFTVFFVSCVSNNPSSIQHPSSIYESKDYALYAKDRKYSFEQIAGARFGNEKLAWKIEDANSIKIPESSPFIQVPLKDLNLGGLFENGYQSVPILCYHQFGSKKKSPLMMPADIFNQQMKYLKDNGYRTISPSALLDFMEYRHQIPKRAILITIDDGYRSIYDIAVPILKKYGFTATVFVYINFVGISKKAMSWNDLRDIKSQGFTIGSHTISHADLTKKNPGETPEVFYHRIRKELALSKKKIDEELGQDTISLSFPYGRQNQAVLKTAKAVGYKIAVTVDRGSNPFFSNPLALNRDMILKKEMKNFISRLKTFNNISLK